MCVSVLLLLVMFGKGLLLQPTCDRRANLQLRWHAGNVQLIIGMVLPCCTRLCVFVFRNPPTCLAAMHIDFAGKIPSIHPHRLPKGFGHPLGDHSCDGRCQESRLREVNGCERFVGIVVNVGVRLLAIVACTFRVGYHVISCHIWINLVGCTSWNILFWTRII